MGPLLAAALALLAAAHPNSLSGSVLEVEGARVRHELLLQPLSLMEVLPGIDSNSDGAIDAAELEARRGDVELYVARHYRLYADDGFARELPRSIESVRLAPAPFPTGPGEPDWIELVVRYEAEAPLEVLALDMRLFFLTSPDHRDFCSVSWDGLAAFETTLSQFEPQRVLRRADIDFPSWLDRLRAGWSAFALRGVHLAFLVALLAGAGGARRALGAALVFALARWVGYGYGLSPLPPLPERFVDLTVALSSAFLAAQLLTRREERPLGLEAAVFGLVHGLALARVADDATAAMLRPLGHELWFGAGVELAQWSVVVAAFAIGRGTPRSPSLARRGRAAVALLAGLYGLYAFLARAGWIGA